MPIFETSFRPRASARPDDAATVVAAGVLAATLAALCHETLGHGFGCVAVGGHVTVLTSIWFRCQGATSLTDAGGGIASLLFGALALAVPLHRIRGPATRLVLLMFGAISLFWFAAQLIDHAALDRDDWHFIALRLHWPWVWRPLMVVVGIAAYAAVMRWTRTLLRDADTPGSQAIRLAYLASAGSAVLAGLMWPPEPVRSAVEGLLTLGVAPVGLLVSARRANPGREQAGTRAIVRSWPLIAISLALFAGFAWVQGRGLGPLAGVPLRH
jgi:hypothetical protein